MSGPTPGAAPALERVLLVDDEPQLLVGLRRQLHGLFDVTLAGAGDEALRLLDDAPPFPVIVSDMRMPGMDGLELFEQVSTRWPDMVRVMLTGNADQATAVGAVNRGQVFRFINKPCPPPAFIAALQAAVRQHQLQTAERELPRTTLMGCVRVLTETLSIVNPSAFGRAARMKRYVTHMVRNLGLADAWQYEAAALLSQVGCVTLTEETLAKSYDGSPLSPAEATATIAHPLITARLLESIPRLENVARMIRELSPDHEMSPAQGATGFDEVATGTALLRLATTLDTALMRGLGLAAALREVGARCWEVDRPYLGALTDLPGVESGMETRRLFISELRSGMLLEQDLRTVGGMLLLARGQAVSVSVLQRLRNLGHEGALKPEAVLVQVPLAPLPDARAA